MPKTKFKYEIEIAGFGNEFKKKTNNIQETFAEFAGKLGIDIPVGGAIFYLRSEGKEAQLSMSLRKICLFKNNENTRLVTETYLLDQIK